jgi:D-alanine-D-alanine ligase
VWHLSGASRKPEMAIKGLDVIFNATHGEFGEDGRLQAILDNFNIPYTGSNAFASALAMNKPATKDVVAANGIKVAAHTLVTKDDNLHESLKLAFRSVPSPYIVKPAVLGSSVGIALVHDFSDLEKAVRKTLTFADKVLVEEFIIGKEATVGVIDHFRNQERYSLIPVEIRVPKHKSFFDYEAKYTGISEEICPGTFSSDETFELQRLAVLAHDALNLRHYSRSDFIVHPKRGIFYLETNTLPGLTNESLLPKAIRAVGADVEDFIEHIINLALHKK